MINNLNGIILLDKPKGLTSFSATRKVGRLVGASKVGHLGTLDPIGTGLLPVAINKATKLFDYFLLKDKTYLTTFKFGTLTDTLDNTGTVLKTDDNLKKIDEEILMQKLKSFIGEFNQMPPIYSAKKIDGRRAYALAREGKEVNLNPKKINVYSIKVIEKLDNLTFSFEVSCSAGTYIRSLARDLGEALGTYGIMSDIRRTKCGMFDIANAYTLKQIEENKFKIIQLENIFDYEEIILNKEEEIKLLNGQTIPYSCKNSEYKIFTKNKEFIGIGISKENLLKISLRLI